MFLGIFFFLFSILRSWEHNNLEYSTTQHNKNYGIWILVMFALFYVGSKFGFFQGGGCKSTSSPFDPNFYDIMSQSIIP